MNLTDRTSVVKYGKYINIALIVLTIIYFIVAKIFEGRVYAGDLNAAYASMAVSLVVFILAVVLLVFSIILRSKNPNTKGLGLMIVSAACLAAFSFFGFMIGILIFIFSGISIKNLSESTAEKNFEDSL